MPLALGRRTPLGGGYETVTPNGSGDIVNVFFYASHPDLDNSHDWLVRRFNNQSTGVTIEVFAVWALTN